MKVRAELKGQDLIEMDTEDFCHLKVVGCSEMLNLIRDYIYRYGKDLTQWPAPQGNGHAELLLREVLLKRVGQWKFPFSEVELCHCRGILTQDIDQNIIAGAHTPEMVTRLTSASSACGTCRPEVEKILNYRLVK